MTRWVSKQYIRTDFRVYISLVLNLLSFRSNPLANSRLVLYSLHTWKVYQISLQRYQVFCHHDLEPLLARECCRRLNDCHAPEIGIQVCGISANQWTNTRATRECRNRSNHRAGCITRFDNKDTLNTFSGETPYFMIGFISMASFTALKTDQYLTV